MEQYKKILGTSLFQGSQLSNFQLNTFLEQDNRILPLGEMDVVVNEFQQFTRERNESTCYRLSGVLRGVFTNILFNVTGDKSYQTILSLSANTGEFNPNFTIFQNFGYKDILLERDGWFFYRENTAGTRKGCVDIYLRPVPNDFYFLPRAISGLTMLDINGNPRQNWYFKITYPKYTACTSIFFQSPFVVGPLGQVNLCQGLHIQNISGGTLNGRSATYIETQIKHGLLYGDQIILRPLPTNTNGEIYNVIGINNDYSFWIDFYDINIPTNIIGNSTITNDPLRFKRIFQGVESQYMVRTFEKITDIYDYQLYPAAFSNNIFNDPIQLYHYNLDIDTAGLKDYLNRPVTEVYLTKIKYTNDNPVSFSDMETWTELAAGLLFEDKNRGAYYSVKSIYGGTVQNPLPSQPFVIETINENKNTFFGDVIDYNVANLTERVLEVPYYRFNSANREDNYYPEGYYYKAHDKIQLLEFSAQVEKENLQLPDDAIPDYAVSIDGVLQWKDLLTPGFTDAAGNGVDYPFLNGCTYIFSEHDLCLYRQNPRQLEFTFANLTASTANGGSGTSTTNNTPYFSNNTGNADNTVSLTTNQVGFVSDSLTVLFPNAIVASLNFDSATGVYTADLTGTYIFNYNLSIYATAGNGSGGANCSRFLISVFLEHRNGANIVNTYSILLVNNLFGSQTYTPFGTLSIPMNAGETVRINIGTRLQLIAANCGDATGEITVTGVFGMDTLDGVSGGAGGGGPTPTNPNITYNYWLAGVNCNNNYGEYIDPVDADC